MKYIYLMYGTKVLLLRGQVVREPISAYGTTYKLICVHQILSCVSAGVDNACRIGEFICWGGGCIPIEEKCDGRVQCADGSDEDTRAECAREDISL